VYPKDFQVITVAYIWGEPLAPALTPVVKAEKTADEAKP
jgi:hypothetical protein